MAVLGHPAIDQAVEVWRSHGCKQIGPLRPRPSVEVCWSDQTFSWPSHVDLLIFTRDSIYAIARTVYAIARPSVCPSVTRVDQSKTVEVRITKFSLHSTPSL